MSLSSKGVAIIMERLRSANEDEQERAGDALRVQVETESRVMSGEVFSAFMNDVSSRVFQLIKSEVPHETRGGIVAIKYLIDLTYEEYETMIIRFANYLRIIFQRPLDKSGIGTLELAAAELGHLARCGGVLTNDFVEFEVKRALEWLQSKNHSLRRLAAVLVLKELAINAPVLFFAHVSQFFEHIRKALHDSDAYTREAATKALRACLSLISKRQSRLSVEWYYKVYESSRLGFQKGNKASVHGSLLILGELIQQTGNFMVPRFDEVCQTVLEHKSHSDKLVRIKVITLLPDLAKFSPDAFVRSYLDLCLKHLFAALDDLSERNYCFESLGRLSLAVGPSVLPYLPQLMLYIRDGLNPTRNKPYCQQALVCISMLAQAVGPALTEHHMTFGLLEQMFSDGLTRILVKTLIELEKHIPTLRQLISAHMLHAISIILADAPYTPPPSGGIWSTDESDESWFAQLHMISTLKQNILVKISKTGRKPYIPDGVTERELRTLALRTLREFDFSRLNLLPMLHSCVLKYTEDASPEIREEASLTCAKILLAQRGLQPQDRLQWQETSKATAEIVRRLLTIGVADPIASIRKVVLTNLNAQFDIYLVQSEALSALFSALNDEDFRVRRAAMGVTTRLVLLSPAHVLPALRRCILRSMSELSYAHGDLRRKEEAALLLGDLIYGVFGDRTASEVSVMKGTISPGFIGPFTAPMIRVLLDRLKDGRLGMATAVLRTLGEIALVDTVKMNPYMEELVPLIIEILRDQSSVNKRQVALRTLSKLVVSTGQVIQPMLEYPELLDSLLEILKGGTAAPQKLRAAALEALGTLGALDPFQDKLRRVKGVLPGAKERSGPGRITEESVPASGAVESVPTESTEPYSTNAADEDFYPTVAINALSKILRDPTLGAHDSMVVQSVTHIFRSLGLNCTPYLPQVMPRMLLLAKDCEYDLRRVLFQHFAIVVTLVKQFIRPYLKEMFDLVELFWFDNLDQVLILVEQVSFSLREEARPYIQRTIPYFIEVLHRARDGLINTRSSPQNATLSLMKKSKPPGGDALDSRAQALGDNEAIHGLRSGVGGGLSKSPISIISAEKTLTTIRALGFNLFEHLFLIVPALIEVIESDFTVFKIRSLAMETVGVVSTGMDFKDYLSSTVQALSRILRQPLVTLKPQAVDTICIIASRTGTPILRFVPMIDQCLEGQQVPTTTVNKYRELINTIRSGEPIPEVPVAESIGSQYSTATGELLFGGESVSEFGGSKQLQVNQSKLRKAWEAGQRSTKDDWTEWMRRLSVELLRESPSPALRACSALAQVFPALSRELFNAAFVSCWTALGDQHRDLLVHSLEAAFKSPSIPPETLQTLLNLAEFMEHIETVLPIDIRDLGNYAQKCHAYAKALHYKELVFRASPGTGIEDLILINNRLEQPEAAVGILHYVQQQQKLQEQRLHRQAQENKENSEEDKSSCMLGVNMFNFGVAGADSMYPSKSKVLHSFPSFSSERSLSRTHSVVENGSAKRLNGDREVDGVKREAESAGVLGGGATAKLIVITQTEESSPANEQSVQLKETWFEQLGRWEDALEAYQSKLSAYGENELDLQLTLGRMRCWTALGEYEQLSEFAEKVWWRLDSDLPNHASAKQSMAAMFAQAAWVQNDWKKMEEFVQVVNEDDWIGSSLRSVLALQKDEFAKAREYIDHAQKLLDTKLSALVGESYNRAYRSIVLVQQLAELNEIYKYKQRAKLLGPGSKELERHRKKIHSMWVKRLRGCQQQVPVWELLMSARTLIIPPEEDIHTWIKFSTICRKSLGHRRLALNVLERIGVDPELEPEVQDSLEHTDPNVTFAYLKYLWEVSTEEKEERSAISENLIAFALHTPFRQKLSPSRTGLTHAQRETILTRMSHLVTGLEERKATTGLSESESKLQVRCRLKLGNMHLEHHDHQLNDAVISQVLECFRAATEMDEGNYKAWHAWAFMNFRAAEHYQKLARVTTASTPTSVSSVTSGRSPRSNASTASSPLTSVDEKSRTIPMSLSEKALSHVVPALNGYFRAIFLSKNHPSANVLQDILRLLTLWFDHGSRADVDAAMHRGFETVSVETWLEVIPQLIARIHTPTLEIKEFLQTLLIKVGRAHPQALVYPLTVAAKSASVNRRKSAQNILKVLRENSETAKLIDHAQLVSNELIRVAILWPEEWNQALEEASTYFFNSTEKNIPAMLNTLEPLHAKILHGYETDHERDFLRVHGRDLRTAADYLRKYHQNGHEEDIHQAWELYYQVFRKVCKEMQHVKSLTLSSVSPALLRAQDLELAVPGTYRVGKRVVRISSFEPYLKVIGSKQRPRQLTIRGSDGSDYQFLLKGHEDLRQDERVMQLFGLVNRLLAQQRDTNKHDLSIQRYDVIPLSHDVGVSGWLPDTDTLHVLIHDFRKHRHVLLDIEQRLMKKLAPDMEQLTVIQKVEIFCHALSHTTGQDLCKVLWLKSRNSEIWLDRRTNFTRSLATMSMVGYILGLGDRHPSNLMLDRASGKIIHIDFGDCFEAAIHREKLPEKVPFRLTRMLIAAMEVSGVEGNYRYTCESVMKVLRMNRGPVMAMLEAFVHDPLINWRLLTTNGDQKVNSQTSQPSSISSQDSNPLEAHVEQIREREESSATPLAFQNADAGASRRGNTSKRRENIRQQMKALNIAPSKLSRSINHAQRPRAMTEIAMKSFRRESTNLDPGSILHEEDKALEELTEENTHAAIEELNQRALAVIDRVSDKLTGRDFGGNDSLSVPLQVQKLIIQATSYENLCVAYVGWCPFW